MTVAEELARADDYLAVVGVTRPDGSVHASLVKAGFLVAPTDDDPSVGFVVAGSALKLGYLRRAGRATVLFRSGWRWASIEGPVRLVGPDDPAPEGSPEIPRVLRAVYQAAGGTHDDWEAFDRAMADDRRCAVFVRATKVSGTR